MIQVIDILKSRKAFEIIEFFIENQDKEIYQSEISRKLRISRNTAFKWLGLLTKNSLLNERISGRMKFFWLNKDNVVVKQTKILTSVAKLSDVLRFVEEGLEIYLYGSAAKGEEDKESDVDLLIIGRIEREKLVKIVEDARHAMRREIRPLVLTPLEYAELSRRDKVLYENIEKSKVRLL